MSKAEDDHIAATMATQGVPSKQAIFNSSVADWLDGTIREGMKVHGEIYRARMHLAVEAWIDNERRRARMYPSQAFLPDSAG